MLLSVSEMLAEKQKESAGYVSLIHKNISNSYLYLNKHLTLQMYCKYLQCTSHMNVHNTFHYQLKF